MDGSLVKLWGGCSRQLISYNCAETSGTEMCEEDREQKLVVLHDAS